MRKYLAAGLLAAGLALTLCACGGTQTVEPAPEETAEAVTETAEESAAIDLTGEWEQTNKNSDDSYQVATISDGVIEIFFVSPDTKSLYWSGTAETPDADPFTWDSVADHEKTDASIMGSMDDTKTFTYDGGELSFDVSMMGTTMTVRMEKVE